MVSSTITFRTVPCFRPWTSLAPSRVSRAITGYGITAISGDSRHVTPAGGGSYCRMTWTGGDGQRRDPVSRGDASTPGPTGVSMPTACRHGPVSSWYVSRSSALWM